MNVLPLKCCNRVSRWLFCYSIFWLGLLFSATTLRAQNQGIEQASDVVIVGNNKFLRWYGHAGRTYFIQVSDPNAPLSKWVWVPMIESGNDEYISHNVGGTAAKGFFRLKYTDQPTTNPDYGDFDGDYIANLVEITTYGTDPLNKDTDGDGFDDGVETWFSTDPLNPDSDSDGLSDGDEYWIYHSNPLLLDTDGDGLSDGIEVNKTHTSSTMPDTDGDDVPDGDEVAQGTDPNSSSSFTFQWHRVTRTLQYDFDEYPPPDNKGTLTKEAQWDAALNTNEMLTAAIPFPDLKARLEMIALPETPPATGGVNGLALSEGQSGLMPNPPCFHATLSHQRLWLRRPLATSEAANQTALKTTTRVIDGIIQEPIVEVIQVTIPANAAISQAVDLIGGFTQNFTGTELHDENIFQRLQLLEVVDKNKSPISKLQVGKMSETGVLGGTVALPTLDIDKDLDHFFVRIRNGAELGGISIKVSTTDNPDAADYNDNATQVDLVADGADAISKSMLLVADDVDDDHPVDGIADDTTGDRTHKVQLGGNLKIEQIKIGTGAWQPTDIKVSVPFKKTVKVKLVNCRYGILGFTGPCWDASEITFLKAVLKERYAQTGIKLVFSDVAGPWISVNGWLDPGEFPTEVVTGVLDVPQVTKDIIDGGPMISQNEVAMYLVKRLDLAGIDLAYGVSIPPKYLSTANISYGNKILIGSMGAGYSQHFTGPHELLHILTDAKHGDFQTEFDDNKMIWHTPGSSTDTIDATKRLSKKQVEKILLNSLAQ